MIKYLYLRYILMVQKFKKMKRVIVYAAFLINTMVILSCNNSNQNIEAQSDTTRVAIDNDQSKQHVLSDYKRGNNFLEEKKIIKEIKIGEQIWMTENLDVEQFNNGDTIKYAGSFEEWFDAGKAGIPAWCYAWCNQSKENLGSEERQTRYQSTPCKDAIILHKHGKLYNFYAVIDKRGISPIGWRVPSKYDWLKMINFLGGDNYYTHQKIKSTNGWGRQNGTNESGFNAIPHAWRTDTGSFSSSEDYGAYAAWWTCSISSENKLYFPKMVFVVKTNDEKNHTLQVQDNNGQWREESDFRSLFSEAISTWGYAIRCIKNK